MSLDLCLKSKQEQRNKNKEFRLPHSIMNELVFRGVLRLTIKRTLQKKVSDCDWSKITNLFRGSVGDKKLCCSHENNYIQQCSALEITRKFIK